MYILIRAFPSICDEVMSRFLEIKELRFLSQ